MDKSTLERFGLEPIPTEQKNTRWYEYAIIQFSFSPNSGNFLVPASSVLVGGLSFGWALLCNIIGASMAFYIVSVMSQPGSKYGIPAQYAIRSLLGIKGAKYISSPMRVIVSIYWFAVQAIAGSLVIQAIFKKIGGFTLPLIPTSLFLSILMSILAIVGFEAVRKMTKYCLPVLVLSGVIVLVLFLTSPEDPFHFSRVWNSTHDSTSFSTKIFYVGLSFAQYVAAAFISSDLSRYAKSDREAHWGLFIGNVVGFSFTTFLGIYSALATGEWNPYIVASETTNSKLVVTFVFLSAMISMVLVNMSNAYSGGFSLLNSFPGLGRIKSTAIFCLFGILLCCFPTVVEEAKSYISLLGMLIGPAIGVIFIEFAVVNKRTIDLTKLLGDYTFNKPGILLILAGTVMAILLPNGWPTGLLTFGMVSMIYALLSRKSVASRVSYTEKNMTEIK